MEITNLSRYTQSTINNLLLGQSPKNGFTNDDGSRLTENDLTSLKQYFELVLQGKIASTTDKKYVLRASRYTGGPDENNKAPDNIVNYDHLSLSGIPSTADIQAYEKTVKEQLENFDFFYISNGKPQLIVGKREVRTVIDRMPNGDNHIHILVNRRAVVDRQYLEEKLTISSGAEEIECIKQALEHMKGFTGALSQSCDFNDHYVQRAVYDKLNLELQANGLAPIANYASYSQNKTSNVKATQETKTDVLAIQNSGYDEAVTEKLFNKSTDVNTPSSLDTVILSKKKEENDKRLTAIIEEARRLTAENKNLDEAQKAISANITLQSQLEKAKAIIEEKDQELKAKNESIVALNELHDDTINDFKVKINVLNGALADKEQEVNDKSKEFDDLFETTQIDLKSKDDEIENIKKVNQVLQSDKSTLTQLNNALQGNIDSQKQTIEMLQAQIAERDNNLKQQADELKFISDQRKLENEKLAEKVKDVIKLEEANKKLRTDNDLLEKSVTNLQNSLNIGEKVIADLRKELAELKVWAESFVEKVKAKVKTPTVKKELDKAIEKKPEVSEGLKSALGKLDEKSALNELLAMSKAGRDILKSTTDETQKPTDSTNNPNKFKPK